MSANNAETIGQRNKREAVELSEQRRQDLLQRGLLSLPSNEGRLVIVVSDVAGDLKKSPALLTKQYEAFLEEAEIVKKEREHLYSDVTIRPVANIDQLTQDFANPEISSMTLIGHGAIERLWTRKSGKRNDFGWRQVSDATTHLKQGAVEQRMCGHFPSYGYLTVPLGTFAVQNLSSVHAAIGEILPNEVIGDEHFAPVFNDTEPVLAQLARLNSRYQRDFNVGNFQSWLAPAA